MRNVFFTVGHATRPIESFAGLLRQAEVRTVNDVRFAVNAFWENRSFHNYADYAMGAEFRSGLQKLLILGGERQCAIMCAETLWWRCHRRIIADYLIAAGETVFHIRGPGQIEQAHMTEAATPAACGVFTYPAKV